jgi:cytochrome c oxidase assembly protein subunit 15
MPANANKGKEVASSSQRPVAYWLIACAALVFTIVVVGGLTRLTHSGLSIVEWQPLVGTLPPLTQADWEASFAGYRMTPEFRLVNFDIGLDGYKRIFWLEYFHRLLGRMTGLVFLLPLVWFIFRGAVRGALAWRLGGIFILGALQGAMGWYMVKSGLVDEPRVSQLRLAAHLGLAFLVFGAQFALALALLDPPRREAAPIAGVHGMARLFVVLTFLMVLSGALVAGLRAGLAYNTFPLMHGQVVPPDMWLLEPRAANFLGNVATVQFDHRMIAWAMVALGAALWWRVTRDPALSRAHVAARLLVAAIAVQFALGVATLLLVVPLPLAVAHQAWALVVFSAAIALAHRLR